VIVAGRLINHGGSENNLVVMAIKAVVVIVFILVMPGGVLNLAKRGQGRGRVMGMK
jgi:hypothetical protein